MFTIPSVWELSHIRHTNRVIEGHYPNMRVRQNSALIFWTKFGISLCRFLIDEGADIHLKTKYLGTALSTAVKNGHLECVQLLYKHGNLYL